MTDGFAVFCALCGAILLGYLALYICYLLMIYEKPPCFHTGVQQHDDMGHSIEIAILSFSVKQNNE